MQAQDVTLFSVLFGNSKGGCTCRARGFLPGASGVHTAAGEGYCGSRGRQGVEEHLLQGRSHNQRGEVGERSRLDFPAALPRGCAFVEEALVVACLLRTGPGREGECWSPELTCSSPWQSEDFFLFEWAHEDKQQAASQGATADGRAAPKLTTALGCLGKTDSPTHKRS